MLISFILYLYVFFVSWTNAFALGPWFPIHVVLLLTAVGLYLPVIIAGRRFSRSIYPFEDIFIYIGIIAVMISGILHPNEKTVNYLMAYFYIFGVGYFALKLLLYHKTSVKRLLAVNTIGVLFVAGFVVFEVLLERFIGFDVQAYIPRTEVSSATYNAIVRRAYGFATEPTILAYYFNTLGPLALWQLWKFKSVSNLTKCFLSAVVVLGWLCTFSAAGVGFMIISILVVLVIKLQDATTTRRKVFFEKNLRRNINSRWLIPVSAPQLSGRAAGKNKPAWRVLVIFIVILFIIFYSVGHFKFIKETIKPLVMKVALQDASGRGRVNRWSYAIGNIFDSPFFGKGIGCLSSVDMGSSANWYLFLTLESGIIAIIPFTLFLMFSLLRILKSKITQKYWFLVGFLAGVFHFTVISTIQHPFLWLLLAIFHVATGKERNVHIRSTPPIIIHG